jgi:plasmid stabilization system protein ParE
VTPRFELTAPAERDLEDIFFEVKERHGRVVAERVYANLLRTFDLLASMPEMAATHFAVVARGRGLSLGARRKPPVYAARLATASRRTETGSAAGSEIEW